MRRHHKFTCNKEPRFPCAHCDFKTTSSHNMNIHLTSKHRERGPKANLCCKCGLMYETYRYLKQHEKLCGLPSHLKRQTNYRYFCDNCDYKCVLKIRMRRHMQHVHVIPDNVSCPTCKRVFKLKKYLAFHKATSRRCAKKAIEMDKIENIPLSKRNKKKTLGIRFKNKSKNETVTEKNLHENSSKTQQVEQYKNSETHTRKSSRKRDIVDYKNMKKERF